MYLNISKKIQLVFFGTIFFLSIFAFLFKDKEVIVILNNKEMVMATKTLLAEDLIDIILEDDIVYESTQLNSYNLFGNKIIINTEKNINVTFMNEVINAVTYKNTIEELINELNILDENYNYFIENHEFTDLLDGITDIKIVKVEIKQIEEEVSYALDEIYEYDSTKSKGTRTVKSYGTNKVVKSYYNITYHDDVEVDKTFLSEEILNEGSSTIVVIGTKVSTPVYYDGDTIWDKLAYCESGGNWATNTGNGYYGGLQFSYRTWKNIASILGISAEYAHQATREQQIQAANYLQQNSGWGQWPSCSKKLGLL